MINVILTSDDFGMSSVYNKEMLNAVRAGLLSSISVLVDRNIDLQLQEVDSLLTLCGTHPISLGLHLEIKAGEDIKLQSENQWEKFVSITGRKPDYIDIHKDHLFKNEYNAVAAYCLEKQVPFRKYKETSVEVRSPQITINASYLELDEVLKHIDAHRGHEAMEIVFHIGSHDADIISSLNKERENDLFKLRTVYEEVKSKGMGLINYKAL